jgi:UDP-glucose 4-epimerase
MTEVCAVQRECLLAAEAGWAILPILQAGDGMSADFDRVLVVGASGRVGRMLARVWQGMGLRPTLQHRSAALPFDLPQIQWAPMAESLPKRDYAAMIVLAGVVPGQGDLAQNAAIAAACLTAAEAAGIGQVLLASSSAVYGSNGGVAFSEDDATRPVNDYGQAKLAMEAVALPFRTRGMQVCALRIGNVAGADALLLNVAAGQKVWVDQFADGAGPLRSYVGPQAMAQVLAQLVGQALPDILNLAAPQPVTMADLARAAKADWDWRPAPTSAFQRITMDCSRLAGLYAFATKDSQAANMVAEWHATKEG